MGFTKNYYILRMMDMGLNIDLKALTQNQNWDLSECSLRKTDGTLQYTASGYANSFSYLSGSFNYIDAWSPFRAWRNSSGHTWSRNAIQVGTNDTAESVDDYKINTFNTQIYKYETSSYILTEDKTGINNTITLLLLNTSGTTQNVRELGIVYNGNLLIYRKVLPRALTVPANGYFKVSFSYTVPISQNLLPIAEEDN